MNLQLLDTIEDFLVSFGIFHLIELVAVFAYFNAVEYFYKIQLKSAV